MATETAFPNEKGITLSLFTCEIKFFLDFTQDLSDESVNESQDESDVSEYLGSEDEQVTRKTCGVTKTIRKTSHPRKKYRCISDNLREKLIDAVENRGLKIKQAAKKLRINYSSAKSIYQVYKKEGRSSKKIMKKRASKSTKDHEDDDEIHLKDEETQSTPESVKVKREVGSESSENQDTNDDRRTAVKNEESEQTGGSSALYMVKSEDASQVKAEFNSEKPLQQYSHNISNSNLNQANDNCMPPSNELYMSNIKFEGENSVPQQMIHPPQNLIYPNNLALNPSFQNPNLLASNMSLIGNNPGFGNPQVFNAQNLYMQNLLMSQYNPMQYNYLNQFANQQINDTLKKGAQSQYERTQR